MITVESLGKQYGDFKALDHVSFTIKDRGITGLLGPNGAGKSTTMKILTGYMPATSGKVSISGLDLGSNILEIKKKIGYLPENNPLYDDMTVEEYLDYMAELKGITGEAKKQTIEKVVADTKLEEKRKQDIKKLSKGYKQRVGLAQSLLGDPEILILDEPTVGLDPNQIVEIRELIKKIGQEKMVIFSSHILAEVETLCNNVIIINKGKIVAQGTSEEIQDQAAGKTKIDLVIQSGHGRDMSTILKMLDGVLAVQKIGRIHDNEEEYVLEIGSQKDIRKELVSTLAKENIQLLELQRKVMKLEDIFAQLTK